MQKMAKAYEQEFDLKPVYRGNRKVSLDNYTDTKHVTAMIDHFTKICSDLSDCSWTCFSLLSSKNYKYSAPQNLIDPNFIEQPFKNDSISTLVLNTFIRSKELVFERPISEIQRATRDRRQDPDSSTDSDDSPIPMPTTDNEYEISSISDEWIDKEGKTRYKVHYRYWVHDETGEDFTWESIDKLDNCTELLMEYFDRRNTYYENNPGFPVACITDDRENNSGTIEYKVHWLYKDDGQNGLGNNFTWESADKLQNYMDKLHEYWERNNMDIPSESESESESE
jgi:hypothetical protein